MKQMHIGILAVAAVPIVAFLVVGTAPSAENGPAGPAVISTYEQAPYGAYLADDDGMSLYLFQSDQRGSGKSTCHGTCAEAWPPLLTEGEPRIHGEVDTSLLGAIERENGTRQITYNGWPLYYFVKDDKRGDVKGHNVKGFGAKWYLVTPQGEPAPHED